MDFVEQAPAASPEMCPATVIIGMFLDDNRPNVAHLALSHSSEPMSNRRSFLKQTAIGGALGLSTLGNFPFEGAEPRVRPNPGHALAAWKEELAKRAR